jgi:SAM-dependent methyltransferase
MNCRICGGRLTELLSLKRIPKSAQRLPKSHKEALDNTCDLNLCECDECRLVQHSGEPVSYYRDVIRATAYSDEMKRFRLAQLGEFVRSNGLAGKTALEVGCGAGEYLELLAAVGLRAVGIENGEGNIDKCRQNGFQVFQGYMGECDSIRALPKGDAFFSFNFFEHLPDLNAVLRNLRTSLNPSAVGLIEVPNFDMIVRKNMLSELIPDHIYCFTQKTLTSTLSNSGFDVVSCNPVWHDYILSAVVKPRERTCIGDLARFIEELNDSFRAFADSLGNQPFAVWGAGHQALTALSMFSEDLANRIAFVVDSAPFKQGLFTPATGYRIVSPNEFHDSGIRAVVVAAAAYNGEITAQIHKVDDSITVAVLENAQIKIAR